MNLIQILIDRLTYGSTEDLAIVGLLVISVLWLISNSPRH